MFRNVSVNFSNIKTPCYIIDEKRLRENLEILHGLEKRTGCRVLLAQKCFSSFCVYPLIKQYISGTASSGLYEARLAHEEMGGENHIFSPAYSDGEIDEILSICSHVVFNSFTQWEKFSEKIRAAGVSPGLRVNPQHSTQRHGIYDPCAEGSRLGIIRENFEGKSLEGIEGLHFHTLCEQDSDALEETLDAFEEKFGVFLKNMKWVNFGGGHHITKPGYDIDRLIKCITRVQEKYNALVYLEPGEAVVYGAGYLASTVLDIVHNGIDIAVTDASAACHMPDVLEMPYRPEVCGADIPGKCHYKYRLAGNTCLAGDIIGDYTFQDPLAPGSMVVFKDMAMYTVVKNNTFNGAPLPSIYILRENGKIELVKEFGYEDFKSRLS